MTLPAVTIAIQNCDTELWYRGEEKGERGGGGGEGGGGEEGGVSRKGRWIAPPTWHHLPTTTLRDWRTASDYRKCDSISRIYSILSSLLYIQMTGLFTRKLVFIHLIRLRILNPFRIATRYSTGKRDISTLSSSRRCRCERLKCLENKWVIFLLWTTSIHQ